MIFDFPNMNFTDDDWIAILSEYLKSWTEIPLNCNEGCDFDEVKFYDGFIGMLLKQTEKYNEYSPRDLNTKFVNSWKYQGKLYRVIHKCRWKDKKGDIKYGFPYVKYHRMIAHWTDDYTFQGLLYKLSPNEKYIILEADTGMHFAFDANKFRKAYQCESPYTEKEREFIFPMYKENIKEYRMTINEFIKWKGSEV